MAHWYGPLTKFAFFTCARDQSVGVKFFNLLSWQGNILWCSFADIERNSLEQIFLFFQESAFS